LITNHHPLFRVHTDAWSDISTIYTFVKFILHSDKGQWLSSLWQLPVFEGGNVRSDCLFVCVCVCVCSDWAYYVICISFHFSPYNHSLWQENTIVILL